MIGRGAGAVARDTVRRAVCEWRLETIMNQLLLQWASGAVTAPEGVAHLLQGMQADVASRVALDRLMTYMGERCMIFHMGAMRKLLTV